MASVGPRVVEAVKAVKTLCNLLFHTTFNNLTLSV